MVSKYTSTPLDTVENWPLKKLMKVLAHIAVLQQREKNDTMNEAIKFENMKRGE